MTRTKRTASRRSMKLWMVTVLLIENECIKQRYDSPFTGAAILDFGELQEFPKLFSWATLLKCTPDQQFMEHLKLCHMHHLRKPHIQGLYNHKVDIWPSTLTSDHINNARNEFLRSDLYEKMVLHMNLALLLKSYDLPSSGVAMLDFDELQEFRKMSRWTTKSDFICGIMGTKNHQKTLYFPRIPGCHPGNWTTA